MNKTAFIYTALLLIFAARLFAVCEGELNTCAGAAQEKANPETSRFKKLSKFRENMTTLVRKNLPSPHSELVLGMTLGIDRLYEVPKFKKMLRDTGTIHVVVVSGYNVTLVYNAIVKIIGSPYKTKNLILAVAGTLFFAFISGFEPPVVRAWVMGSVISLGKFYGRKIDALKVLLVTGLLLAIVDPTYLYNLSFQLSFLATLSLVMYENSISNYFENIFETSNVFLDDLSATVSAQILIWPYLSYKFSQISLASLLVNMLVLWTVPLATVIGSVFLALGSLSAVLGAFLAKVIYLPLDFFVVMVEIFAKFEKFVLHRQISLTFLIVYYFLALILYFRKLNSHDE